MIPLNMPPIGTAAGYTITATRRPALPRDRVNGTHVVAIEMLDGTQTHEVAAIEDHGEAGREARAIGLAVLNALTVTTPAAAA